MLYMMMPVLLFLSCTDDSQENNPTVTKPDSIDGLWNLVAITSSIDKPGFKYQVGDINWTFAEQKNQVDVKNHIKSSDFSGMKSGSYNFKIAENTAKDCTKILTIRDKDGVAGCLNIANDTLTIHNAYAGHYNLIFIR